MAMKFSTDLTNFLGLTTNHVEQETTGTGELHENCGLISDPDTSIPTCDSCPNLPQNMNVQLIGGGFTPKATKTETQNYSATLKDWVYTRRWEAPDVTNLNSQAGMTARRNANCQWFAIDSTNIWNWHDYNVVNIDTGWPPPDNAEYEDSEWIEHRATNNGWDQIGFTGNEPTLNTGAWHTAFDDVLGQDSTNNTWWQRDIGQIGIWWFINFFDTGVRAALHVWLEVVAHQWTINDVNNIDDGKTFFVERNAYHKEPGSINDRQSFLTLTEWPLLGDDFLEVPFYQTVYPFAQTHSKYIDGNLPFKGGKIAHFEAGWGCLDVGKGHIDLPFNTGVGLESQTRTKFEMNVSGLPTHVRLTF